MRASILAGLMAAVSLASASAQVVSTAPPPAIASEPARDAAHPARMEVAHIPTGGVKVNGVVLIPAGAGPHPTVVLFHGLPGNEKNLDLAQALRRAGFTVLAANYRGSWGSPGAYRFAQDLEDAKAFLAFVRDPANAKTFGFDPAHIILVGHSLGGWVTAETLAADAGVLGGVTISAGDMGAIGLAARSNFKAVAATMDDNRETLADVTGASMAQELKDHGEAWSFAALAPKLKERRLLVLYSNDFVRAHSEGLIAGVKAAGGTKVQSSFVDTDHSWSDQRLALESLVINWAQSLIAAQR
jgi:uncharacterized protein